MGGDATPGNGRRIEVPPGLEPLMPAYVAEMTKDAEALLRLLSSNDYSGLSEHAHAMKGKCAMFGDTELFDLLDLFGTANVQKNELVTQIIERVGQLKI